MKPPNGSEVPTTVEEGSKPCQRKPLYSNDKGNSNNGHVESRKGDNATPSKGPSVRFPEDIASQILSLGPGNFLSRSQDSLTGPAGSATGKRNGSIPTSKRPQSSLGIPKSNTNGMAALNCVGKVASRTMSSAQLTRKANSPSSDKSSGALAKENKHSSDLAKSNAKKQHVYASQQVADARINRTKLTVTELQKQKQELEMHVSDLVKKAESKQAELAKMKMEIRRLKEEKTEQVERLAEENENLKKMLKRQDNDTVGTSSNSDGPLVLLTDFVCNGKSFKDIGTSPLVSTKPFNSDEGATDSDDVCLPGITSNRGATEWDRQSTSSEISVACLQDRIVQMEETHYSTNEELQATLQELTDLQDIVNDLMKENQNLCEEKALLYNSLCKQSEKVDNCRLQIENLKHLLLSGADMRLNHVASSLSSFDGGKPSEREQKLIDLLKSTHDEHEELLCKFEGIRSAYKISDEEKREQQEMLEILKDRARLLEGQLEHANIERKKLEENLFECKQQLDKDRREIVRITNVYEKERCRVEELLRHSNAKDKTETQSLLDSVRAEKDRAEDHANTLEEHLVAKNAELEKLHNINRELQLELKYAREDCEKNEMANEEKSSELEHENEIMKKQLHELKTAVLDLNERCHRHTEDKKEYRANILTLQQTVDDATEEREHLRKELTELLNIKEQEAEEWRQFQSDLQVAVVVANDFKMEAQEDIERLSVENCQLRDKLTSLSLEVEKMRNNRSSPSKIRTTNNVAASAIVPSSPSGVNNAVSPSVLTVANSPDIKSRMEGYLSSVERSTGTANQPNNSSTTNNGKCVLSVRALVESLENASSHRPGRLPRSSMRSPGAIRQHGPSASVNMNGASSDHHLSEPLSKSSGHLASRPVSLEGVQLLVTKQQLKSAISESQVQSLTPAAFRGSPQKRPNGSPPDGASVDDAVAAGSEPHPRGILRNQQQQQPPRKVSYLDIENKDPLAKLMKDAPRGSRRNALLRWCQNRIVGYRNVEITNFSSSWNDGLAFCALMHSFLPDKVPFHTLDTKDKRHNFTLAFQAAESVGIPASLNVDEMLSLERPDWQSVMSYVTWIYKHFEGY